MLRALLDVNLAKFLSFDLPLFNNIMGDLFPGIERPDIPYTELKKSIRKVLKRDNLQWTDHFVEKTL